MVKYISRTGDIGKMEEIVLRVFDGFMGKENVDADPEFAQAFGGLQYLHGVTPWCGV
jgi:hypothetical protein